jgi:hypothetical protein
MLYYIFWVIPRRPTSVCRHFRTLCPFFIGCVNKKNNQDKIARVLIQVKIWLKLSLGQSEGGGLGRGCVRMEEWALEGSDPKCRPALRRGYKEKTVPCRSKEEEPSDGRDLTILLREGVSFLSLSLCRRGLQDLLKIRKPHSAQA